MKLLWLLIGRAIDHTPKKKKPFTVPSDPSILLTCEKIIVGFPDFLDLYKNLPHRCKFSVFKPSVHSPIINHVLTKKLRQHNQQLLHGSDERLSIETSVHESLNDRKFTESTQLTKCAVRFNFHWSNTTVSFETDHFIDTLCKYNNNNNFILCTKIQKLDGLPRKQLESQSWRGKTSTRIAQII